MDHFDFDSDFDLTSMLDESPYTKIYGPYLLGLVAISITLLYCLFVSGKTKKSTSPNEGTNKDPLISNLANALENLREEHEETMDDYRKLNNTYSLLCAENEVLSSKYSQNEKVKRLTQKCLILQEEHEQTREEYRQLVDKYRSLKLQHNEMSDKYNSLRLNHSQQVEKLENQLMEANHTYKELYHKYNTLESDYYQKDGRLDTLSSTLREKSDKYNVLSAKYDKLKEQVVELQEQIADPDYSPEQEQDSLVTGICYYYTDGGSKIHYNPECHKTGSGHLNTLLVSDIHQAFYQRAGLFCSACHS